MTAGVLSEVDKEHFLTHGWVKIPEAFSREQADAVTSDVWTRLGLSSTDKTTWNQGRIHLPKRISFDSSVFAPRAWAAICELCGGEDRIEPSSKEWRDNLIVNLGTAENEGKPVSPKELTDWHIDGDFFVHYLDSREQGLLVVPCFTDIVAGGGGTLICPKAIPTFAKWLYDHPEGVSPRMMPRGEPDFGTENRPEWYRRPIEDDNDVVEVTAKCGDVYLLHPLMLHAPSSNPLRRMRIITNPVLSLKEPFCFDRGDGNYSLVEKKTMMALGKDGLPGWEIKGPRERVVPFRLQQEPKMRAEEEERARLAAQGA